MTTYRNFEIVRSERCPAYVKLQIRLKRGQKPGLAEWVWERPYKSAIIVKGVLERALRNGELDALEKEISDEQSKP